jgi:hypothetical protein
MMRLNLRLLGFLAPMALAASLAEASPPSSPPPGGSSESPTADPLARIEEYRSIGVDRRLSSFAGNVLDVNDNPISGVEVKLFVDGQPLGVARTDGSGHYEMQVPYDPSADVTALLWFTAPERSLMPKELVLRESKASQGNGLLSRCLPRATIVPGRQFRVYLFDPGSRNKELAEMGCLP